MKRGGCQIEGCHGQIVARGYCGAHYQRWRKHGHPLAGGTAIGEAMRFYREVVLAYEGDACLIWPFATNNYGYGQIWNDGKTELVSRLVCAEENGNAPSPLHEVAHSCGRGHEGCVARKHLRWDTRSGNFADKLVHGTHDRGERSTNAKITEEQARQIRALSGKVRRAQLAEQFGISISQVRRIQLGERWAWI